MRNLDKEKLLKLQEKVKEWSKDRGITINGKSTTQTLKLISEFSEIFEAFKEEDDEKSLELLKDAIGDVLVVLINLTELIKKESKEAGQDLGDVDLRWCMAEKEVQDEDNALLDLGIVFGELADSVGKQNYQDVITQINKSLKYINTLAEVNELKIEDCLNFAYNEIKDRKGFLNENGNFIKNTDPNYEKLYKEFLERQK